MGRLGVIVSPIYPRPDALVFLINEHGGIPKIFWAAEVSLVPAALALHMEVVADLEVAPVRLANDQALVVLGDSDIVR
jgi:hypothetical protein